jgi:hypothetical protein
MKTIGEIIMKPFNLKYALAGERVYTRNGIRVWDLHVFPSKPEFVYGFFDLDRDMMGKWDSETGKFPISMIGNSNSYDLMMGLVFKKHYIVKYTYSFGETSWSEVYDTYEHAKIYFDHLNFKDSQIIEFESEE